MQISVFVDYSVLAQTKLIQYWKDKWLFSISDKKINYLILNISYNYKHFYLLTY